MLIWYSLKGWLLKIIDKSVIKAIELGEPKSIIIFDTGVDSHEVIVISICICIKHELRMMLFTNFNCVVGVLFKFLTLIMVFLMHQIFHSVNQSF